MIPSSTRLSNPPPARAFLTWGAALFVSGAVHAGAFALALNWREPGPTAEGAPPAVMIDLLPAAPVVPKFEAAPGPEAPDSFQQPDLEHAQPIPERAAEPPPLPRQDVAVAIPEPMRVPQREDERAREETKKASEHRAPASRSAAPQTFEAQRHGAASAKAAGAAASPSAVASWKSELMARLNRYKRYPPGAARDGTSLVAFNVNRSGSVSGTHLVRSSGESMLDQEAVSLPRRASPLPPPPEGMVGGSIALTVPVHFAR